MVVDAGFSLSSQAVGLGDPIYAKVRERLRKDILAGEYQAGERLKIKDIARRYGVSTMPVREAFQKLEGEGLVQIEPNRGARVRRVDLRFIQNMYDIRVAIDGMLVRKATERMTPATLDPVREAVEQYERSVRPEETPESFEWNRKLHRRLHESARNEDAMAILDYRWGLIECIRATFRSGPSRIEKVIEEHRLLLAALERKDADEAERIAKLHCENARIDLIAQMQKAYGLGM